MGVSSHQLGRVLEVQYNTAWFLSHRIREAMRDGALAPIGGNGFVEVDEAFIGTDHEPPFARAARMVGSCTSYEVPGPNCPFAGLSTLPAGRDETHIISRKGAPSTPAGRGRSVPLARETTMSKLAPLCLTVALSTSVVAQAAPAVPRLDVTETCRAASKLALADNQSFDQCMKEELGAKELLAKSWSTYPRRVRARCTAEVGIGGSPSYVEVSVCLEMDQAAAALTHEGK
jgi:hypothetical protein